MGILQGQVLTQELIQLARRLPPLAEDLRLLADLVERDGGSARESALGKARAVTDKVLRELCAAHAVSWGNKNPTIENMIGPLIAGAVIPQTEAVHVRAIQSYGNPGAHGERVSETHVELGVGALAAFLRWYADSIDAPVDTAPAEMRSVLTSLVFTDVKGYSALVKSDEERALAQLAVHNAVLEAAAPPCSGRVVKTMGDGYMLQFGAPSQAVRWAVAVQQALAQLVLEVPGFDLVIRVGVHVGEVKQRGGDLFGHGVNVAARAEPLATPGRIAITEDARRAIEGRVTSTITPLGARNAKNMGALEVFEIDPAREASDPLVEELVAAGRAQAEPAAAVIARGAGHPAVSAVPTGTAAPGRTRLAIGLAAAVLLGGAVTVWAVTRNGSEPAARALAPVEPENNEAAPADAAAAAAAPTPPAGMVYIAGGAFEMGSDAADIDAATALCRDADGQARDKCVERMRAIYEREQPRRAVSVAPLFIDAREATNAEVATWLDQQRVEVADELVTAEGVLLAFVPAGAAGIERVDRGFRARAGAEPMPATRITWEGARRYCAGQRKRLPTEAEWELAARGAARRTFAWGEGPPPCDEVAFARWKGQACAAAGAADGPPAVGTSPRDVTPEGVHDLGGSVSEWTADAFVDRLSPCEGDCIDPVTEPTAPDQPRVIRGGNWAGGIEWLRGAGRGSAAPADARPNIGVRCVRALPAGGSK